MNTEKQPLAPAKLIHRISYFEARKG